MTPELKEHRNRCKVIGKLLCRALPPKIEQFKNKKMKPKQTPTAETPINGNIDHLIEEINSLRKELRQAKQDIHYQTKMRVTQYKFDAAFEALDKKIRDTRRYAQSMAAVFFATMIANLAIAVIRAIL